MAGLPEGWQADYDGTRWFYKYPPTGHIQYHFPSDGDQYPDYVDASSPAPVLAPEELLESQQQIKRHTSVIAPRKTAKEKSAEKEAPHMSATAQPVSDQWSENDNEAEDGAEEVFQPESFMYLGPGTYVDVSPLVEEEDEAAKRAIVGPMLGEGKGTAPNQFGQGQAKAERTGMVSAGAFQAELEGDSVARRDDQATRKEETVQPAELAGAEDRDGPIGWMAEMPTEHTPASRAETHPDPVELGDSSTMAPVEQLKTQEVAELASEEVASLKQAEVNTVATSARSTDAPADAPADALADTPADAPVEEPTRRSTDSSNPSTAAVKVKDNSCVCQKQDAAVPVKPEPNSNGSNGQYKPYAPGTLIQTDSTKTSTDMMSRQRQTSLQREASLFLSGSRRQDSVDDRVIPASLASPRRSADDPRDTTTRKSAETIREVVRETKYDPRASVGVVSGGQSSDGHVLEALRRTSTDLSAHRGHQVSSHPSVLRPARKQQKSPVQTSSPSASTAQTGESPEASRHDGQPRDIQVPKFLTGQGGRSSDPRTESSPPWSPAQDPTGVGFVPRPLPRTVSMAISEFGTGDPGMVSPIQSRANSISSVAKKDSLRRTSSMSASIRHGSADLTPSPLSKTDSGQVTGLPSPPSAQFESPYSSSDTYFPPSKSSACHPKGNDSTIQPGFPPNTGYAPHDPRSHSGSNTAYGGTQPPPQGLQRTQSVHHTQDTGAVQPPTMAEQQQVTRPPLARIEEQPESNSLRDAGRQSSDTVRQSPTLSIQPTPQMFRAVPQAPLPSSQHEPRLAPPPVTNQYPSTTQSNHGPSTFAGPVPSGTPGAPLTNIQAPRQLPIHAPVAQPGWPKQTPLVGLQSPPAAPQAAGGQQPQWQGEQGIPLAAQKGKEKDSGKKWTKWFKGSKASSQPAQPDAQRALPAFPNPHASSQGSLGQAGMAAPFHSQQPAMSTGNQAPPPDQQWMNQLQPNQQPASAGGVFKPLSAFHQPVQPQQLHHRNDPSHAPVPQLLPSATFPGPSGVIQGASRQSMPPQLMGGPVLASNKVDAAGRTMGFGYNGMHQTAPPPGIAQGLEMRHSMDQQHQTKQQALQHQLPPAGHSFPASLSQHPSPLQGQPPPQIHQPPHQQSHSRPSQHQPLPPSQSQYQTQPAYQYQQPGQPYYQQAPHQVSGPQFTGQQHHHQQQGVPQIPPPSQIQHQHPPQLQSHTQQHPQPQQVPPPGQFQSQQPTQHQPHQPPQPYSNPHQHSSSPHQPYQQQQQQQHSHQQDMNAPPAQSSQLSAHRPPPGMIAPSYGSFPPTTAQQAQQWNKPYDHAHNTGAWSNYPNGN